MKEWILIAAKYQEWISVLYLQKKKHKNLYWGYFCKCKKLPKNEICEIFFEKWYPQKCSLWKKHDTHKIKIPFISKSNYQIRKMIKKLILFCVFYVFGIKLYNKFPLNNLLIEYTICQSLYF